MEIRARFSEKGLQTSDGYPLGRGVYPTLDELNGALAFQELIVFFRDGDIMLQGLKFVGFYGTSELLDEGMTPLPSSQEFSSATWLKVSFGLRWNTQTLLRR